MAFSCFPLLLLLLVESSLGVDSANKEKLSGPVINVTKHLSFPDFSLDNPGIVHDVKLLGSAKLSKEKSAVQIPDVSEAADLRHLAGRAIYSSPVRLLDPTTRTPASFETTFDFQFENDSSVVPSKNDAGSAGTRGSHGGSGLTFIIVPDEFTVGRSGPWLGMLNDACDEEYKAVAVEFDTRHNPEFGDPNDNHVGINLGSIVSTRTINLSDIGVSLKDGSIHRARIRYDGPKRWIEIHLGSEGQEFPSTPAFSGFLDLSPHLKEYMFVGFSASTGNLTQIHNVLSWNFTSTSQAFLRIPSEETCESKIILGITETPGEARSEPISNFLIFAAVVVLALAVLVSLYYNGKRRRDKPSTTSLPEKIQRPRPPNKPRSFTVNEVSCATRGFGEYEVLGSDYRGTFYRGKLPNSCQVAVKRFSAHFLNSNGLDGRRILKEICAISRIRHPNLVPIRGWCQDKGELMVIYDFFPNGGLDKWLFGVGVLPWTRRFKVVKDVAEALSFLHSRKLAHKNMKTTSVLLDVTFRAVLGDFGFVLSGSGSRKFESAVSQAADVFEFGVFALEVIAGRSRSDPEMEKEEKDLLDFAWRMHERNEKVKVFDRRMGSLVSLEQAIRVLEIGLLCTLNESKGRPSMEEVVEFLVTDGPIPELPPNRPVALFPYSSATGLCASYSCAPFQ
ncbi:L-type lectin-domain containing receptor kinase VIII.2-like [Syzygium oleosum]|uniref:L-type lectin-domain containing receptor kinase VIII.2-like n=1 Tax=Syzygium oleosum TaxID=219896 RepID=UPI0011D23E74|nr:L-type lectin-domain containing receptor kinase VIII.2-like [Syzygium oleosum]